MNAPFSLDNRMTVVLFAGMGGGCDGLEDAGFHVHVAINHDPVAVAVHEKRHPHTKHLRCDVFEADPRKVTAGRGVRALHASPDCTHFSVAKGSKPVSKRRRSLAWVICRWAGGNAALVAAFLAQHNTGEPGRSAEDPLSTIVTLGSTQGVVAAMLGNLHGTNQDGRPIEEPLSTIAAGGSHAHLILGFLQHYFGSGKQDDDVRQPLGALTGKARYGLVEVIVKGVRHYIDDIGIRMLEPEEGAAAHGFRPGALPATIDGRTRRLTKTEKYHLVGNSVPPRMIELLAECNVRRELVLEAAE